MGSRWKSCCWFCTVWYPSIGDISRRVSGNGGWWRSGFSRRHDACCDIPVGWAWVPPESFSVSSESFHLRDCHCIRHTSQSAFAIIDWLARVFYGCGQVTKLRSPLFPTSNLSHQIDLINLCHSIDRINFCHSIDRIHLCHLSSQRTGQ